MSAVTRFLRAALLTLILFCFANFDKAAAQPAPDTLRLGYQKSSTLTVILKTNGELEKALAPLGVKVTWHEFTSGLPLLEALNLGHVDFSADVADTVPLFAQAAGAKLAYVAEESASPTAQAILVPNASTITSLADLRGKKIAATKGAGSHFLLLAALQSAGLTFKDISPAYLTPADGRAAFVGSNVDAWVVWDPFLTSALKQSGGRVLRDGSGIASYKRYYLAAEPFAEKRGDVLEIVFAKLKETGRWVKQHPKEAADLLSGIWNIDSATVEEANSHRSYGVGIVTRDGLAEQQVIADTFTKEGLIQKKIDATAIKIWQPKGL
jgi:sulfonate transport system substrate-binding protein